MTGRVARRAVRGHDGVMQFFAGSSSRAAVAILSLATATALAQEATVFVRGSEANVRLVGPGEVIRRGLSPAPFGLPAGTWQVHFATDAAGKPGSLELDVPEAATVGIAIDAASPVASRAFVEGDGQAAGQASAHMKKRWGSWVVHLFGSPDERDYRVVATVAGKGARGGVGLVARWTDHEHHYRFTWDRERAELCLEREMGPDTLVLARVPSPPVDERPHQLALQVQGFRVQGFCDDALMLQVLDGAYASGEAGSWEAGNVGTFEAFAIEPPAAARASSALVTTSTGASLVAATGAAAGHFYVVELALDRPHALLPQNESGGEIWLLQRPAAPRLVLADWRGSLGAATLGLVPPDGLVRAELHWPDAVCLRRQAALVRALVVSPDGEIVIARTPAVALWL